jgi:hypothetical protein
VRRNGQARMTPEMAWRARQLYDVRLSYAAIAAVISLDFETDITADQVRYRLHDRQGLKRRPRGSRLHFLSTGPVT